MKCKFPAIADPLFEHHELTCGSRSRALSKAVVIQSRRCSRKIVPIKPLTASANRKPPIGRGTRGGLKPKHLSLPLSEHGFVRIGFAFAAVRNLRQDVTGKPNARLMKVETFRRKGKYPYLKARATGALLLSPCLRGPLLRTLE